jgi:hypothetical protein
MEEYSFNDGEYVDDSYQECIDYMLEQDMSKEDIVGTKLNILTLEQCIPENIIVKMQDLLHDSCEHRFDEGGLLGARVKQSLESFKKYRNVLSRL